MPNKDGTGPMGQGAGTGRLKGGCAAGRGNNKNNSPGKGLGRRNSGNNGPQNGGRGQGANNPNNTSNK
ncbi:MAG TPA: DUF5320 domain-containing protein [Syntrophomonas sp.]|nr:DUF5320 domain-containing protein [Syntrophomonas sp.]HRW11799.1 DUF5320 domain-containing protein [Syntrophomonas sp.]